MAPGWFELGMKWKTAPLQAFHPPVIVTEEEEKEEIC
jgi:hypothetical protein